MKKIKIAHMATTNMSLKKILLNKLIYLKEKGYEVHGISSPGEYQNTIEDSGVIFHSVSMARNISLIRDIKAIIEMKRLFKKEGFHIVHTHTAKAGFIGRIAAKIAGVPIIIHTSHGLPFYEGQNKVKFYLYKTLEKLAGRYTDILFSQNKEDMDNMKKYKVICEDKIFYEGNGVNITELDYIAQRADKFKLKESLGIRDEIVIGLYARMEAVKGHLSFITSFKEVVKRYDNIICLLAGTGPLEDSVKASIYKLGLEHYTRVLGQREDIPALLSITDILVLPSEKEGIPRIVMEAMTLGVPVVATDVLGTRELVQDQETGILIPYKNLNRLTESLLKLIDNPAIRQEYGFAGRKKIEQLFDEKQVVERVNTIYEKLIEERIKVPAK